MPVDATGNIAIKVTGTTTPPDLGIWAVFLGAFALAFVAVALGSR